MDREDHERKIAASMRACPVAGIAARAAPERDDLRVAVRECVTGRGGVQSETRTAHSQLLFTSVR
jgi:hypothetical protein